jgi:hypothetical protein
MPSQPPEHQPNHCSVNHRFAGSRQLFVILAQPSIPSQPGKGAFNDPAPGQYYESFDIIGVLDDFKQLTRQAKHPVAHWLTIVSAIGPYQLETLESFLFDPPQQFLGPGSFLNVGFVDQHGQKEAHHIH